MKRRFNLICHGMMAFWQENASILSILIPDEGDVHHYAIGRVIRDGCGTPSIDHLDALPPGRFSLEGLTPGALTARQMQERFDIPVLRRNTLELTGQYRTRIDIPTPFEIRCYCGSEAPPAQVAGATPPHVLASIPSVVHDVVVVSWSHGTAAGFQIVHESGNPRFDSVVSVNDPVTGRFRATLGVYAQPKSGTVPLPHHHGGAWNKMMKILPNGAHPDLHLSLHGIIPDGPPAKTAIGASVHDLTALADVAPLATDRIGCGSGAILDL